MPYYQRSWNVLLGDKAPKQTKKVRTVPPIDFEEQEAKKEDQHQVELKTMTADLHKVIYTQNVLRKAIEDYQHTRGADLIKQSNNYLNYVVNKDQAIFKGKYSEIHVCINTDFAEMVMICREFRPTSLVNPDDSYLKMLRLIGTKSPFIIQTMDIFVDYNRHVFLFQEYATRGNGMDFVKAGNYLTEPDLKVWAQQIYQAMDYLGLLAISHRAIRPKHIMLKDGPNGVLDAKLGGFRDAIIYWDSATNDIIDQPCKAVSDMKHLLFQAPEEFGQEGEFFNPVDADVWSFGSTMWFFVSRRYPFNAQSPEQNLDAEIRNNLSACKELSDEAKHFFYGLLRTNTKLRTGFDAILFDPWINSA